MCDMLLSSGEEKDLALVKQNGHNIRYIKNPSN